MPKVGMNATFLHFEKDLKTDVLSIDLSGENIAIPNLSIQEKNLGVFGFTALWNVFTGGKIIAMNSVARASRACGFKLKYKSLSNNLTVKLVKVYYGLALANYALKVRQIVMNTSKPHLEDAQDAKISSLRPQTLKGQKVQSRRLFLTLMKM